MIVTVHKKNLGSGNYRYEVCNIGGEIGVARVTERRDNCVVAEATLEQTQARLRIARKFGPPIPLDDGVQSAVGDFTVGDSSGEIFRCAKNGRLPWNGIVYEKYCLNEREYKVYEVGLGRKGIYLCIWQGDRLVAEISKGMTMKKFECSYEAYADRDIPQELLLLMCVYWDLTKYNHKDAGHETFALHTWQKEMKNKFDPDFIRRVTEQDSHMRT